MNLNPTAKFGLASLFFLIACSDASLEPDKASSDVEPSPPNVLVILADDLGYSDIGAFGSEISTPNLDSLAASGMRIDSMKVHVFCTPTRSMLLTGVNNVTAGIGTMAGEWRGGQRGAPGYEAYLSDRVVTIASLLSDGGYDTFISGKWDLGGRQSDDHLPSNRGFDKSWVLVEGSSDHFRAFPSIAELPDVNYRASGQTIDPPEDFFSSDTFTDKMLEFIESSLENDSPFFGYLAYTAPHYPLQAPQEYIDKYAGVYDVGYEEIRRNRIERLKAKGVIDPEFVPASPHDRWPSWEELSPNMKALETARMQVYAAMVDNMDHNIGRIVRRLEEAGELDNTLILFLSDNGAEGGNPLDWADYYVEWAETNFDLSIENTGSPTNYSWTGPQWAHVSSAPFSLFKAFPTEGGISSPMIVSYPQKVLPNTSSDALLNVKDIAATILDYANIEHPGNVYKSRSIAPIEGSSFRSLIEGRADRVHDSDKVFVWEMMARRGVRKGDWKLIWVESPWDEADAGWSLYNLAVDPAEQNDVADQHQVIVEDLVSEFDRFVERNGLIVLDDIELTYTNTDSHFNWLPRSAEEVQ
jgi:arylsulfatase